MALVNAQFPQLISGQNKPLMPPLVHPSPIISEPAPSTSHSNLAGNHHYFSSPSISHNPFLFNVTSHDKFTTLSQDQHDTIHNTPWIMDIGATNHMVCSTSFFTNSSYYIQAFVQLPNGTKTQVTHIGTVKISESLLLIDVLCVSSFAFNLISVSKLT